MTRQFNTDMERDINRIAIATEKMLKRQDTTNAALLALLQELKEEKK